MQSVANIRANGQAASHAPVTHENMQTPVLRGGNPNNGNGDVNHHGTVNNAYRAREQAARELAYEAKGREARKWELPLRRRVDQLRGGAMVHAVCGELATRAWASPGGHQVRGGAWSIAVAIAERRGIDPYRVDHGGRHRPRLEYSVQRALHWLQARGLMVAVHPGGKGRHRGGGGDAAEYVLGAGTPRAAQKETPHGVGSSNGVTPHAETPHGVGSSNGVTPHAERPPSGLTSLGTPKGEPAAPLQGAPSDALPLGDRGGPTAAQRAPVTEGVGVDGHAPTAAEVRASEVLRYQAELLLRRRR